MKYLPIFILVAAAAFAYLYYERPDVLRHLGAPSDLGKMLSPEQEAPKTAYRAPQREYIDGSSHIYIDPSHVKQVDQPAQYLNGQNLAATPNVARTFVPPDPLPAANNWNWKVGGITYGDVVVNKVEADRVWITYDGGGTQIDTAILPPEIQHLLNYDPIIAAQATAARMNREQASAMAQAPSPSVVTSPAEPDTVLVTPAQQISQIDDQIESLRQQVQKHTADKAQPDTATSTTLEDDQAIVRDNTMIARLEADKQILVKQVPAKSP